MNKFLFPPLVIFYILISIVLFSCKKDPGQGGTSFINGKVYARYYNKTFSAKLSEGYAPKIGVYIIYGNNVSYGDNQSTSFDGSFEFRYLQKGDYTIYAYSKDSTGAYTGAVNIYAPNVAIIKKVTITGRKQTVTVPDIQIIH